MNSTIAAANPGSAQAQPRDRIVLSITIAANCIIAWASASQASIDVPTRHLDGAYQTASGLFRLAAGQWPGQDFFSYLGLGPLLILYPAFQLAGGDLAASEFAARLMTLLSGAFCVGLVTAFLVRRNTTTWACLSGTLFLVAAVFLVPGNLAEFFLMVPGNSLRPLRTFAPFVFLPLAYWFFLHFSRRNASIATGVLVGLAPLWSNDYGIPTAGLLLAWVALRPWAGVRQFIMAMAWTGATSVVVFVCAGLLITQGALVDLLSYWYVDVRRDQWWYFGPWTRSSRVYDLIDLAKVLIVDTRGSVFVLAGMALLVWRERSDRSRLLLFIGLALCGGGLLSTLGGHRDAGYFLGLTRWSVIVVAVLGTRYLVDYAIRHDVRITRFLSGVNPGKLRMLLAMGTMIVALAQTIFVVHRQSLAGVDPEKVYVPELGGYVPGAFASHLHGANAHTGSFVEEYWGLWSGLARYHGGLRVDAIIHALGRERKNFEQYMAQHPDVVVTTPKSYSSEFQPWSISANWWFYRTLLQFYVPEKTSPSTLVWQKSNRTVLWPEVPCGIAEFGFHLGESAQPGYFEIVLNLQIPQTLTQRGLVFIKNNINQAFRSGGYLSIDPRSKEVHFPLRQTEKQERFDLRTLPDPMDAEEIIMSSCKAYRIESPSSDVLP